MSASKAAPNAAKFWGRWGANNPEWSQQFYKQRFNRGYGQPLLSGRYVPYAEETSRISYYARRFDHDWLKILAMRVDAQRLPLTVVRRQLWLTRGEYWLRKIGNMGPVYRAAKCEWAYIKGRLKQPFTWQGRDIIHLLFWLVNIGCGFCIGEILCRRNVIGYEVGSLAWTPARPRFAPGFYHVHGLFDDSFPWEQNSSHIAKWFGRGYFPNDDAMYVSGFSMGWKHAASGAPG